MTQVVLASQSPRRKQLLEWALVEFEIIVPDTDESYPAGLSPREVALHISREKAMSIQTGPEQLIIAADTIVVLDDEIIGKPRDRAHAIETLSRLQGRSHEVITGVAMRKGAKLVDFYDVTEVGFHPLTQEQISFYVDRFSPMDKAGAYAIQEWIGVTGIKYIKGDFYNVMGLPVSRVLKTMAEF